MLSRAEVVSELRRVIAKLERQSGRAPKAEPAPPEPGLPRTAAGHFLLREELAARPAGSAAAAAAMAELPLQPGLLDRVCVLDTETTGLAGGTGTIPFLVGIARAEATGVTVLQHVLASPATEAAFLDEVLASLAGATLLVTYNGKSFDLPLLRTRLILSRRSPAALDAIPHLDLLTPSRRLWRSRTPDCRLVTLEAEILGRRRSDDTPGSEAPAAYHAYLKSSDPRQLTGILRHNRDDLLGTLALCAHAQRVVDEPLEWAEDAAELAAASAMLGGAGDLPAAESALRRAAELARAPAITRRVLSQLAKLHRKQQDHDSAAGVWEQYCFRFPAEPKGWVELAKAHERGRRDPSAALEALRRAPADSLEIARRAERLSKRVSLLASGNAGARRARRRPCAG